MVKKRKVKSNEDVKKSVGERKKAYIIEKRSYYSHLLGIKPSLVRVFQEGFTYGLKTGTELGNIN